MTLTPLKSDTYVELSQYRDQHFRGHRYDQEKLLKQSSTLYVGNLSFYTTEEQIYELFSKSGDVKKIVMGLDKVKKTACGFCFVDFPVKGTLYVGNLSFYTTEEQIYELFSKSGDVKKIVMGLDKVKKTACGFCFVEYYLRGDAENCMRYVNGTRLDDRIIRTDWDAGFKEGRQFGRGRSGGQVRDEYRQDYDAGRGGYGKIVQPL